MRILITTGIYPPAIGGPSQYARELQESLKKAGHQVKVRTYRLERSLPTGIRHLYFFFKIIPSLMWAEGCITLDTFSVGFPSVFLGFLLRKKVIVRIGGDFLWEHYLERTKKKILLREFYATEIPRFTLKEKIIFSFTRWTLNHSFKIAFSTEWQKGIWAVPYALDTKKSVIIENFYDPDKTVSPTLNKTFVGSSRPIKFKNLDTLERAFKEAQRANLDLVLDLHTYPHEKFIEVLKHCYAVILVSLGDVSPNIVMDAIRLGKPFILTKENGIYERVKEIALFVDPLHEKEITQTILWLADPANYALQRKKIEQFSFSHSWEKIAEEFVTLFTL